MKFIKSHVE